MTLQSKTCSIKYIERKSITLYEKTCLSACRRRQCPIEQGNLLEIDRGSPMSAKAQKHRLGLYLRSKDKQILRNVTQESVITNSKQLEPKKSNDSFKDNSCSKSWNFVKLIKEVSQKWEKLRKFQSSAFDTMARRKFVEDQNTILELSGRVQELQNEVNCMNDSKEFQDAESIRSGNSHLIRHLKGCCDILPQRRAAEKGRQAFGTHMVYRETFLQIQMRHHQHLILKKNCINGIRRSKSHSIRPQWRKVKGKNKIKI